MSEEMIHIILCQPHFMVFPGFPDYAPSFLAAEIFDMFGGLAFLNCQRLHLWTT